jgi:DNA-binding transcriptional LysR family regulator
MGRLWLASLLPSFLRLYPALEVEVDYSESYIDLIAERFDAAIRVGVLRDSRLIAKRLGDFRRVLGASPDYIRRNGAPTTPQELSNHNCLGFLGLASFPEWCLSDGKRAETIVAVGSLRSNDSPALLEAARAGIGILGIGEWLLARDFAAGTLVRVLPKWVFDADGGIYLVRPSVKFAPARTKAFVAWISDQFKCGMPWNLTGGRRA